MGERIMLHNCNCGSCPEVDAILTSFPPKVRCPHTGTLRSCNDICDVEEKPKTITSTVDTGIFNKEAVNHPSHYNTGKYEVIEVIEDWNLDFCLGNAIKYIARAGKKDPNKTIEDLNKAIWYINRKIGELKVEESKKHWDE